MKNKIKRTLIQYYNQQRGTDYNVLGRAISWRFRLIDNIKYNLPEDELVNTISGFCLIHRQIEPELATYQDEIQQLSVELEQGNITQDEFQDRLEGLTVAILVLAFLAGSENQVGGLYESALELLQSGGVGDDLDLSSLPEEVQEDLNSEIAIAISASGGLASEIATGKYEDNQQGLFSRLAMWVTTALGIVSLGKLYLDSQRYQIWLYSPLKRHCDDCDTLNGQVHTVAEWDDFIAATDKRPQGRGLACGGFRCGCGLYNADGPSVGNFV